MPLSHSTKRRSHSLSRVIGSVYSGTDGTISVDLEESLEAAGLGATAIYPHIARSVALVAHAVGVYEDASFTVIHAPVDGNDHHGSASTTLKNKALRREARAMADSARFLVPIDNKQAVSLGADPL
jgi:hypothetical protein